MTEHDKKMKEKGYNYKLIPQSGNFEPLYSKSPNCANLLRMYPEERFSVEVLKELSQLIEDIAFDQGKVGCLKLWFVKCPAENKYAICFYIHR